MFHEAEGPIGTANRLLSRLLCRELVREGAGLRIRFCGEWGGETFHEYIVGFA
jgi:broad specificity phosphatase PhoE